MEAKGFFAAFSPPHCLNGKVNLGNSYGDIKREEVFLVDAHISPYPQANRLNHDSANCFQPKCASRSEPITWSLTPRSCHPEWPGPLIGMARTC